jgi:hypothetical protein
MLGRYHHLYSRVDTSRFRSSATESHRRGNKVLGAVKSGSMRTDSHSVSVELPAVAAPKSPEAENFPVSSRLKVEAAVLLAEPSVRDSHRKAFRELQRSVLSFRPFAGAFPLRPAQRCIAPCLACAFICLSRAPASPNFCIGATEVCRKCRGSLRLCNCR